MLIKLHGTLSSKKNFRSENLFIYRSIIEHFIKRSYINWIVFSDPSMETIVTYYLHVP